MSRIETIPKDVVEKITNELSPGDFVNFCSNNYSMCNSNEVYFRRMQKDFPFLIQYYPDINKRAKNIYLEIFSGISRVAEESVNLLLNNLGELSKYFQKSFREDIYSFFFNQTVEVLKSSLIYSREKNVNEQRLFSRLVDKYHASLNNSSLLKHLRMDFEMDRTLFHVTSKFIKEMFKQLLKMG